jgi:hypothetical protein
VTQSLSRGQVFRYERYETDAATGTVSCHYSVDGRRFAERVTLDPNGNWADPGVDAAARLVFLLAGVSYYKTAAPPVIDLGSLPVTGRERAFLREYYLDGLGEFAFRNGLDLYGLRIEGPEAPEPEPASAPDAPDRPTERVLIPFGGGIDSIVTVELVRPHADAALFVVNRPGDRFDAIERPAALTGLPVVRADREIDPQLLRSRELGFLNGHVPVTGILSAIAVLAAVLDGRNSVIMSNEWSASVATIQDGDRTINHQYSKSYEFEAGFRDVLAEATTGLPSGSAMPDYFSALRPRTELWIAERFAQLRQYHDTFRSCNRAFHIDKSLRLDHWCGQCDKCCFIDLILAPFLPAADLERVFSAREPLTDPALAYRFRALLGTSDGDKPFECVGEVNECRAATLLAARRPDRTGDKLLEELAAEVSALPEHPSTEGMLRPVGDHFIPDTPAMKDVLA